MFSVHAVCSNLLSLPLFPKGVLVFPFRFMSNAPRNKILQAYVISLMPEGPDFLA